MPEGGLTWAKVTCRNGLRPLLKEFAGVRKFLPKDITTTYFDQNTNKNRLVHFDGEVKSELICLRRSDCSAIHLSHFKLFFVAA